MGLRITEDDAAHCGNTLDLSWDSSFSCGIPSVDAQHKRWIQIVADLQLAMMEGRAHSELSGILNRLVSYTESHLRWEEALMKQYHVESLEEHHLVHAHLREQIDELRTRFNAGRLTAGMPVVALLRKWLFNHIKVRDKTDLRRLRQLGVENPDRAAAPDDL